MLFKVRMVKVLFALIGLLIFFAGFQMYFQLEKGAELAVAKDDTQTSFGMIGEGTPPCSWQVREPERVMSENKTQAVVIDITNKEKEACESYLSLRAPGFDYSPQRDEQTIKLEPNKKGSISWIITPRKSGTFDLAVSDILNTQIFGVTVTNSFGMSAGQAKLFSILGTIFGPMFTVPWWFDLWRQRRKKQEHQKNDEKKE